MAAKRLQELVGLPRAKGDENMQKLSRKQLSNTTTKSSVVQDTILKSTFIFKIQDNRLSLSCTFN